MESRTGGPGTGDPLEKPWDHWAGSLGWITGQDYWAGSLGGITGNFEDGEAIGSLGGIIGRAHWAGSLVILRAGKP